MTILPPLPGLGALGLTARRLDEGDTATVTEFCHECSAFFTLVTGESSAPETAHHVLQSRPPEVDPSRKHVVGFTRNRQVVAIVDLLEGFPAESEWYAGLLLLAPSERSRGLGTAVWSAIETWIRAAGGRQVRLIVQQQNPGAARFWRSVGFGADGEVKQVLGSRSNLCWRFVKRLEDTSVEREQPS